MENYIKDLNLGLVKINEPMSMHTTIKIGGNASIYIAPKSIDDLLKLIKFLRKENKEYLILGSGANMIISDLGLEKPVIDLSQFIKKIEIIDESIIVSAGNTIIETARLAMDNGLSKMEALNGIPGTIGGGIYMNAGAYGTEFSDIVEWVEVIDENSQIERLSKEELEFSYRASIINKRDLIILRAKLALKKDDPDKIKNLHDTYKSRRIASQPLTLPSAGSTFKRPEGYYAAALIEEAGLKGLVHGGLRVSDKHSGFIVNHNGGSFKDWIELTNIIKKEVYDNSGVSLELENLIIED